MKKIVITDPDVITKHYDKFISGEEKGEIVLPVPVMNILEWFTNKRLSPCAALLDISQEDLDKVIYYAAHILRMEDGSLRLMDDKEFAGYKESHEDLKTGISYMGAPAIKDLLDAITEEELKAMMAEARKKERDCMAKLEALEEEMDKSEISEENNEQYCKFTRALEDTRLRMEAIRTFSEYGSSKFIINKISMFPLEIKAMLNCYANCNPYTVMDSIPVLYKRISGRCSRLEKLRKYDVPEIIIRNEQRLLQEYVDALLANGRRGKPVLDAPDGSAIPSLSDIIEKTTPSV